MGGRDSAPHGARESDPTTHEQRDNQPQRPPRGPGPRPPVNRHAPRRVSVPPATTRTPFESGPGGGARSPRARRIVPAARETLNLDHRGARDRSSLNRPEHYVRP